MGWCTWFFYCKDGRNIWQTSGDNRLKIETIKYDESTNNVFIEVEGEVQMYAGDRGTSVFPSGFFNKQELKKLILRLQHEYNKIIKETP